MDYSGYWLLGKLIMWENEYSGNWLFGKLNIREIDYLGNRVWSGNWSSGNWYLGYWNSGNWYSGNRIRDFDTYSSKIIWIVAKIMKG